MQVSGGHLLPPVQTLVATIIFSHREKMQVESGQRHVDTASPQQGSEGSAAGGRYSDLSEWPRPRCSALPVADKAEQKCVPGSVADAAVLSARKIPGTPNG